jgi:hypothetical protein
MHTRLTIAAAVTLLAGVSPLRAQRVASELEQQQLEQAAATHYAGSPDIGASGRSVSLDPRLYHQPLYLRRLSGDLWEFPDGIPTARESASHSWQHLSALMRTLGLSDAIDNARACPDPLPAPCRIGAFDGAIAFGPALVKGDSAQLILYQWDVQRTDERARIGRLITLFRFTREANVWRVTSARGIVT